MAWLTQTVLERAATANDVAQLASDDTRPTSPNADTLAQAIAAATGLVKGHLRGRYPTETDAQTASATVTGIACDVCMGILARRRSTPLGTYRTEVYNQAIQLLRDIRDGRISVPEWEAVTATEGQILAGAIEPQTR